MESKIWYAMDSSDVLKGIGSRTDGLTESEARQRLEQYGSNRLPSGKKTSPLIRFLKQFDNLLIYVLLASAIITALMAHWVDSSVIFGVVFINAIIGFIQEGKAEKAMEAIRNMLTFDSSVMRDGKRITLPAEDVVPGDIVLLESGDKIPADLRLFKVKDLRIDEALLTGESVPVEKSAATVPPETLLAERENMAFAGTFVTSGQASGIVVATAGDTEIGRISELVGKVESLQTPLLRKIAQFARQLTVVILAAAAIVFAFGVFVRHQPAKDMFLAAVGLAVAAIPEGLPAIITITLAIGVNRMARRNAIIRRLPAVETLGSVNVICSDKTGTLTKNEMTVTTVITADTALTVTGTGYDPHGEIRREGKTFAVEESGLLMDIARAGMLCNDSSLRQEEGVWRISGDPTEAALIVFGVKCGIDKQLIGENWLRMDVIPFESQHRFMATLNHDHKGRRVIYIKGAPETLLEKCAWQRIGNGNQPLDKEYWQRHLEEVAKNGQRSLALACKEAKENQQTLAFEDIEGDIVLLGLCGIIDPPREEAMQAVKECQEAGIRVKMITGDHRLTAQAIGAQMGIGTGTTALSGEQLEHADRETLRRYAVEVDIFGRVSPEHKLILVQALQAQGQVVAMTGDGVNDAPALKQADVGVAMGIKGTEVAKEASEMVLADDNFASIASAVSEGRTVYDNIRKSILFILPTSAAEALVIVIAIFLGYLLPITPVQILWVNMITAVTLSLALAFEPGESDVMKRPPREPAEPIISGFLIWRLIFVSSILVAGTFGLFLWELARDTHIEAARTVAVNTLVMFEFFYLFNSRQFFRSSLSREGLFGNRYVLLTMGLVVVFQLLFTYLGPMQHLFQTVSLGWAEWSRIVAVASSVFILVEIEKALFRLKK
ncbi:MAG: cation-transporting P-type ATPase [Sedimentisphaerales bacterium]|nr:cation-transporting P-type ATPase [Sedimentisphaerales bacterium]